MISLKPSISGVSFDCPKCRTRLTVSDFVITGMRNLAELNCRTCGREYYGDPPSGQGLYTPFLLDKVTGEIYGDASAGWFGAWLADSYRNRTDEHLDVQFIDGPNPSGGVVVLNCLDTLYGHSLLKLLNAQCYLDHRKDIGVIAIVPKLLEWMLPAGLTSALVVDLPLSRGTQWNTWLTNAIKERLSIYKEVYLSPAHSHPHADSFNIERFTGVDPFPIHSIGRDTPRITFIWRDDRKWVRDLKSRVLGSTVQSEQLNDVSEFAEKVREKFPQVDFAVAGLGTPGGFPQWIKDLRRPSVTIELELEWCRRYAESDIVVGVHGSNMLLPSAHAGAVIELLPPDRLGNYLQDILFRGTDGREMCFRYRFLALSTSPTALAETALSILRYQEFAALMGRENCLDITDDTDGPLYERTVG